MEGGNVMVEAVLFDFGGVLAEEGFKNGLSLLATMNDLDPESFFETARDLISSTGYLTGKSSEADYFRALREKTAVNHSDAEMRRIILDGFILRGWMLDLVDALKAKGVRTAVLSDQTDWLDLLDEKYGFSKHFERVFNSYHLGRSKSDPALFTDVVRWMGLVPEVVLFIDDTKAHIERARSAGLHAIAYETRERFLEDFALYFPDIADAFRLRGA